MLRTAYLQDTRKILVESRRIMATMASDVQRVCLFAACHSKWLHGKDAGENEISEQPTSVEDIEHSSSGCAGWMHDYGAGEAVISGP